MIYQNDRKYHTKSKLQNMIIRHEAFDNISIINPDFLNQFYKVRTYNELIKLITSMSKEYQQFDYLDSIKRFHSDFDLMSETQV